MQDKNSIIHKIKEKKELADLPEEIISEDLDAYLEKHGVVVDKLSKSDVKIIVKQIRSQLRLMTGRFQKSLKKKLSPKKKFSDLLELHASTAERIAFYPELKKRIDALNIRSILDLGCGLNPLALATPQSIYYAVDIKQDELDIIQKFFRKNNIRGKTFAIDLRKTNQKLPKADLCILFKVIDILEKNPSKVAQNILKNTKCKYFLVSFATKTLSGKPMRSPRRYWFENMLKHINYSFTTFSSDNEIFYLIEKTRKLI